MPIAKQMIKQQWMQKIAVEFTRENIVLGRFEGANILYCIFSDTKNKRRVSVGVRDSFLGSI